MQMMTRVAGVFAATAAAVAMMGAPAFASSGPVTVGNTTGTQNLSILSGNYAEVPITVPVDICGDALAILGFANASCQGGAAALVDSYNS
jgi:small secreted domain DUF320